MRALQDKSRLVKNQNKLSFPPDSAQLGAREPEQQPRRTMRDEKYRLVFSTVGALVVVTV